MLNIKDLEERHTKYKIKSYIPHMIFLIIISITFIFMTTLINSTSTINPKISKIVVKKNIKEPVKKKIDKLENIVTVQETLEENAVKKDNSIQRSEKIQNTKKVILSPSLDFMRRVNTPVEIYSTSSDKNTNSKKKVLKKEKPKKVKYIKEEVVMEEVISIPAVKKNENLKIEKKSLLKISINQDQEDIKHVIKRFKVNNNPALSLFVAKKYYQLGDYHKSYNYALITNQLNNNIEASWIIFAKSLMKLEKKDMAIKTLKRYIDSSHSPRAKILLDEIQSGKFK